MFNMIYSDLRSGIANHPTLLRRCLAVGLILITTLSSKAYADRKPIADNHPSPIIPTRAMDVPQYLTEHFNKSQLYNVIKELNEVKIYTPQQFFVYLRNSLTKEISAGAESLVLQTQFNITKVSLYGMQKDPFWSLLLKTSSEEVRQSFALKTSNDETRIQREILGQLVWRHYDPLAAQLLAVSSDLQALQRSHEYGQPLNEILKNPNAYNQYDKLALWKEVIRIQSLAEMMLLETGLSIDLRSPSNLILMGDKTAPKLSNIDFELILPTKGTLNYYRLQGWTVPEIKAPKGLSLGLNVWPLMPNAILSSTAWNLTYEQSLDYIKARHNVSTAQAIAILARTPRYKNEARPDAVTDKNILAAQKNKKPRQYVAGQCRNYF